MAEAHLLSLVDITSLFFVMAIILSCMLLFLHFFTQHLKNIIHKVSIFCGIIGAVGFLWHISSPFLHKKFQLAHGYVAGMLWSLFLLSLAYLANRLVDQYVWNRIFLQDGETTATTFLRSVVSGLIYLIFIVLIIGLVFQKEVHILATFITGSGLLLGYAGTDIIKELFAGIALNLNPAFRKGDFLKIKECQAKVVDINWRYVVLQDITANLMYVPNTDMVHHIIYNYSGTVEPMRIGLEFHTHPNVPPQLVIDLVTTKLKLLPHLAKADWFEDNVVVHIKNCNGHSMEFEARILIDHFEYSYEIRTMAYKVIWYTLTNSNIPLFSYLMRVNYEHQEYESMAKTWHKALTLEEVEVLFRKTPVFKGCSTEEIKMLAKHARMHEFVPTQHLFSEGDSGSSLFILASGTVQLRKTAPAGEVLTTITLGAGSSVGINGVITGEKRVRSAVADSHVVAYEVSRKILRPILARNSQQIQELADEIVREEVLREHEFEAYLKKRTTEQEARRESLVGQIQDFLGIKNAPNL